MPSVDVPSILDKLGVTHESITKGEIRGFCPDHRIFTGKESSDPNWFCNVKTGMTNCYTEGRGSNLLWIVMRLMKFEHPSEAVKFMTGIEESGLYTVALKHKINLLTTSKVKDIPVEVVQLDDIRRDVEKHSYSERVSDFFMKPNGKKLIGITEGTLKRYRVFERTWGRYGDRAIIPFFDKTELVGFAAIDLLGLDRWLENSPLREEKNYRKVLYPYNFKSGEYLFGYDDCSNGCESLIITEGPRDVMKLWQEGYKDSVACLKTHISDAQMLLISKLNPKRIYLMFDGNDAGWNAIRKNSAILQHTDDSEKYDGPFAGKVWGCFLRSGFDPKNLDRNGIEDALNKSKQMVKE